MASLGPWGCPSSCARLSAVSRVMPSWRKACSSLSVCWIFSSSWLPRASLFWAAQTGPQPSCLTRELSSVSDSCSVTPSRVIRFEQSCRFWLWSWPRLRDWAEVSWDDADNCSAEASDDVTVWLSVDVCTLTGIAPETWLISDFGEHERSWRSLVPEKSGLLCDPVCFSSSLDVVLAETAMFSPWVILCSAACMGEWSSTCSEDTDSLTGGCSLLGECSGDRWHATISSSCFSFCSSCLVARRTEPAGQSHNSVVGGWGCEGGVEEVCVTSEDSPSSWCSGRMTWGLWEDGGSGEDEEEEGVWRDAAGCDMASISVTIWRTDIPLSWWVWWIRSGLVLSELSSDSWETKRGYRLY